MQIRTLAAGIDPEVIFTTNVFATIGAIGALGDHGLQVTEDVGTVGCNDTPLATGLRR